MSSIDETKYYPGTTYIEHLRAWVSSPNVRSSQKVASQGLLVRHCKSDVVKGDHFTPTDYCHMRFTNNCKIDSQQARLAAFQDGKPVLDWTTSFGPDSSLTRSFVDHCPFGVWFPNTGPVNLRMRIPTRFSAEVNNKLLEKIDNQSINLGAVVAEMAETVLYVSSVGLSLAKFGTAILTGNLNKAARTYGITKKRWAKFHKSDKYTALGSVADQVAARWVEFNFAIKPTLNDISDIATLYNEPNKVLKKIRLRASTSSVVSETWRQKLTESDGAKVSHSKRIDGVVKASITYSVEDPSTISLKALGLNNIPASAYEAVPFSWLVDYVVNIGEFLNLMTAAEGLVFQHGYISMKAVRDDQFRKDYHSGYGAYKQFTKYKYVGSGAIVGYTRSRTFAFPRPSIRIVLGDLTVRQASYALSVGWLLKRNAISASAY